MSETSGFFDAELVGNEYDRVYLADQFAEYFSNFIGNGIFQGSSDELQIFQETSPSMKVRASMGKAWINGYWYKNDSEYHLAIDPADGMLNRIDLIVLQWDNLNRVIHLKVKKGEPSITAEAPKVQRDSDFYELGLAEIDLKAGTSNITQSAIKDLRMNSSICGWVTGLIDQVDTTTLYEQFDAYFQEFKTNAQENYDIWTTENEQQFNLWFETVKGQLEGDVAANLQLQINSITDSKGKPDGICPLDVGGKVPTKHLPDMDFIPTSAKGQPDGVCPLGPDGKIPIEYGGGVPTTLTVNSVPKGATITVTDGETTFTDVAKTGVSKFNIPKAGNWNVKAEKDGVTDETTVPNVGKYETNLDVRKPVYGVEWDGTANTKWSRTDDAIGFVDPNPAIHNGTGSSPFDNIMPWVGMTRVSDPNAGELVKIPKFYYKWTVIGNGLKLQITMEKPDETYFVSPAHMDRGDGKGERDVVYVGRYHCSANNWKSETNVKPRVSITRSTARSSIHNLGANVWQWDWHMHMTVWMLYLVEFADWNCQTAIGYGCGNNSGVQAMGKSDAMQYHTGTPYSSRTTYGVGVQYRYIEGLWDNVYDWVDGCYYNNSGLNIINDPNKFSDTTNGTAAGVPTNGYPSKFAVKDVNGFQVIYPIVSNGSDSAYTCDDWYFDASNPCLYLGGYYYRYLNHGIGYVRSHSVSSSSSVIGPRLQVLP